MSTDGLRHDVTVHVVYDDRQAVQRRPLPARPLPGAATPRRLYLCLGVFAAVFSVLAIRLAHLSFNMEDEIRLIRAETNVPARVAILDHAGRALAVNRQATGVAIDGRDVWDDEEAVRALAQVLPGIDQERLRSRLAKDQYTLIEDDITPQERLDVIALGLPGVRFPETQARAYPQKDLAAHVVGYTIAGRGGATGLEHYLDQARSADKVQALRSSIDVVAQQILEDELLSAMREFSAKAAWGVILVADTGEVRALASLPDFNPNRPQASEMSAWRNRAMSDVYELGSAFKPITIALALDHGAVDISDRFDVTTPIDVGGWTIRDYTPKTGALSISEIVQYSSNIGTVHVAEAAGLEAFRETFSALRLTDALQTELPETRKPLYSSAWRPSEFAAASYGHGIAVSPLQLTAAFAAVINGGEFRTPTFLAVDTEAGAEALPAAQRVFSAETSARMRIILRKAVTDGTGRAAEATGYYPIGKTATADKPGVGGYQDRGPLVSSFIGAFPGYDPQYVLLISLDEPQGTDTTHGFATAGYVAAPVFRRVVERVGPALGLLPVGDDVAFDGFVGLRRDPGAEPAPAPETADALATLLTETLR